eukprot:s3093_g6.t1
MRLANFAVLLPYVLALLMILATVLWFACARTRASICAWWTTSTEGLRAANSRLQQEVNRLQNEVRTLKERTERDHIILCRNTSDLDDYRDTVKDLRNAAASRMQQIQDLEEELRIARAFKRQSVYVAPYRGEKWHAKRDCSALSGASNVTCLDYCSKCVQIFSPPSNVKSSLNPSSHSMGSD